jgi:hypothetical protein
MSTATTMSATETTTRKRATNTFGALKQIEADLLSVGYAEAGPADGPAVILLQVYALIMASTNVVRTGGLTRRSRGVYS